MRTLFAALVLVACSPAAAPSDGGPPLAPGWALCPPECSVICVGPPYGTACWVPGGPPQCVECDSYCEPPFAGADGAASPRGSFCIDGVYECGGVPIAGRPDDGRCYRRIVR